MKRFKILIFIVIVFAMSIALISCSPSKPKFNNSVNESVNYYKNVFITSENDDSGINPMSNEDDDNQLNNGINSGKRVNSSSGNDNGDDENENSSDARKNKTVDETSGKTSNGSNGSNGGKNDSSYKVGDTVIENNEELTEEEKKQAEENERIIEEAIEEKFVQYMPVFTHRVIKILSNKYGASVAVATKAEYETYVSRLIDKNFEKNIVKEADCFKADCINGLHVILEVDKDSRLVLTIYESEKFFK